MATCPICGVGDLTPIVDLINVEYRGMTGRIESRHSVCSHCKSEQAGAEEVRANKRAMIEFRQTHKS